MLRQKQLGDLALQQRVQLVPLDLVGGQDRDQIVDVRAAGDEHRQPMRAVEVHPAAASRRVDTLPVRDRIIGVDKRLLQLTEQDEIDFGHAGGQPQAGVDQRGNVRLRAARVNVQRRLHRHVAFHQRLDLEWCESNAAANSTFACTVRSLHFRSSVRCDP